MTATFSPRDPGHLVHVDVVPHGTTLRLTVRGEVDSSSAPVLERHLDAAFAGTTEELVVDLREVTFLDSAGLCVLANAHRRAAEQKATMRVLAATRAVVRPLQITGLWSLLGAEQIDEDSAGRVVA
ncbi:STAS domain-containing protein [Blastococcus sp. CCUG 61487]|uniref:STAS domain-containing protein n=1 Tax=Blastococcus sp. CCUG 61487 TaxID=1840703 RepID=UPI00113AB2C6|nr:STAS domain-containing protein [Blastococcus sp. CCUG 61487]TKJ34962.1 hypothetical protein A6V29_14695 [Blastococcus sp. CCUG 61487]